MVKKCLVVLLLTFGSLVCLWSEEKEADEKIGLLKPVGDIYATTIIGYGMGGARQGVFIRETAELVGGSELFGFGIGSQIAIYSIPQLGIDLRNDVIVQDTWECNFEIGVGWRIKTKKGRLSLWQHLAPIVSFEGYMVPSKTDPSASDNVVYIMEFGIVARQVCTIFFL